MSEERQFPQGSRVDDLDLSGYTCTAPISKVPG